MSYYVRALLQYADFGGRASRREFWYFALMHSVITTALLLLLWYFAVEDVGSTSRQLGVLALNMAYHAVLLIPTLAVGARRLHDRNISSKVLFAWLAPIIGPFVLMMFWLLPTSTEANRFGPPTSAGTGTWRVNWVHSGSITLIISAILVLIAITIRAIYQLVNQNDEDIAEAYATTGWQWIWLIAGTLAALLTIIFATFYRKSGRLDKQPINALITLGVMQLYPLLHLRQLVESLLSPEMLDIPDDYKLYSLLASAGGLLGLTLIGLAVSAWQQQERHEVARWGWAIVAVGCIMTGINGFMLVFPDNLQLVVEIIRYVAWIHFGFTIVMQMREQGERPELQGGA